MASGQKASARKSGAAYKPMIVHPNGRTEILGQRVRPLIWRGTEPLPGGPVHSVRGKTFPTRDEAVAYAAKVIERREEHRAKAAAEREERHARYARQAEGR